MRTFLKRILLIAIIVLMGISVIIVKKSLSPRTDEIVSVTFLNEVVHVGVTLQKDDAQKLFNQVQDIVKRQEGTIKSNQVTESNSSLRSTEYIVQLQFINQKKRVIQTVLLTKPIENGTGIVRVNGKEYPASTELFNTLVHLSREIPHMTLTDQSPFSTTTEIGK